MELQDDAMLLGAGALVVLAAVWWISRKGSAAQVGVAAGQAVGDAAAGVVVGIGQSLGVPATELTKCEACKAAGDVLGASFACSAGDFLSWVGAGMPQHGATGGW